eukprot:364602_1
MPYDGEMIFDARGSNFPVTSIEMYSASAGLLGNDSDNNGEIMIYVIAGDYTIDIQGNVASTGIYHVDLECVSSQPTNHPITPHPSFRPTTSLSNYSASSTTNTAYGDNDATPNDSPAYLAFQNIVLIALILSISCCCCCVAGLFYKYLKRKKQINAMITIQSVPCDVDLEREKVALWMRYTVQLPQYVRLFISQGFDTMETLQCIKCKA